MTEFNDLPKDADGNILTHPVLGWLGGPAMDSILLALDYSTGPADPVQVLTFILHPHQALELAEMLQRHANRILGQQTPPPSRRA